jgi:hypothetical protein
MTPKENEVNWLNQLFEDIIEKNNLEIENLIWQPPLDT